MENPYLEYYSRKDIQKQIVRSALFREVAVAFSDKGYGKRPDILQFENDVFELAKLGATSFHISEEHWKNPLQLKSGMSKKELDDLRVGWDLVLDIDCNYLEYSKIAALILVDAIKFHKIRDFSIKFSGNNGFHIGIPFKAFPNKVNNIETRLLFPESLRVIANYLKELIRNHITSELLKFPVEELANNTNQAREQLITNGKFDPFKVLDIDTVLISSRHLFRAPYSINEKSGLVSIPVSEDEIKHFIKESAKPENIKINSSFLDNEDIELGGGKNLIIQAFDYNSKLRKEPEIKTIRFYEDSKDKIPEKYFPGCIKKLLVGNLSDGRKRSLFILINFLKSTGYSIDEIKNILSEWNQKNMQPLKQGYIQSQISWHSRQKEKILPPNCDNNAYYSSLGVKDSEEICSKCKNPVIYALRAYRNEPDRNKGSRATGRKSKHKF